MNKMESDSDHGGPAASANPQCYVRPEILEALSNFDLSSHVVFKESKVVTAGACGDISKSRCILPYRGKIKVSIKRLRFYMKEDIKTLFEKEIYVWSKLRHVNVLPLLGYAFDKRSGYPLLVSEWMDKGSAWNYVNTHPDCDLIRLVIGIAQGLSYLHKEGVIHSDIKSDNILVSDPGDALICDFGCSRMISASRSLANLSSGLKGTTRYMAYELLALGTDSKGYSEKTDVWAFGMTVFELLARERPYQHLREAQVALAIIGLELPSLPPSSTSWSSRRLEEKEILWDVCQLCWNHNPTIRPDMASILNKLRIPQKTKDVENVAAESDFGDMSLTCSSVNSNETVVLRLGSDLTPGKLYGSSGGRDLDVSLNRATGQLERGPRVTAVRMQRRRAIVTLAPQCGELCGCQKCSIKSRRWPASIEEKNKQIEKDIRRLLLYLSSKGPLSFAEAINHISDVSVSDSDIRDLLRVMDKTHIISDTTQAYSDFRRNDVDRLASKSSRKALVSLDDTEVYTLLQEVVALLVNGTIYSVERPKALWRKVAPYLDNPMTAFIVVRILRRILGSLDSSWPSFEWSETIEFFISCIKKSPYNFEWDECDHIFTWILSKFSDFTEKLESTVAECILRYSDRLPRTVCSERFQNLSLTISGTNPRRIADEYTRKSRFVQGIISAKENDADVMSFDALQSIYPYPPLQRVLRRLACPLELALSNFFRSYPYSSVLEDVPTSAELPIYSEIARSIDSIDFALQDRAWEYANYFFTLDIYRCDIMLEALSATTFATPDFSLEFKKAKRKLCIPRGGDLTDIFIRHVDRSDQQIHLRSMNGRSCCNSLSDSTEEYELKYIRDWTLKLQIENSDAFSSVGFHPLVAGYEDGKCVHVAWVTFSPFHCAKCNTSIETVLSPVAEGMKPKDLRVEVSCPHIKGLLTPERISVPVLRYVPDAYLDSEILGVSRQGVDATGPFSWRPAGQRIPKPSEFWARVVTVQEAERILAEWKRTSGGDEQAIRDSESGELDQQSRTNPSRSLL